jgi:hypothetical protein
VDPGESWLLPAGRWPNMQQWHSAREVSSGKFGPREIVNPRTHSTKVAWCRGHDRKRYYRNDVVQETQKGRTFGKRRLKGPECNSGIRDQGLRQQLQGSKRIKNPGTRRQLCLKIKRTSDGVNRKAFGLEFVKRGPGMSSESRQIRNWRVWRGRSLQSRRKTY